MEPTTLTPELIQAALQMGGTPALVGLLVWRMWNGTGRRIENIERVVNRIDRRLLKVELTQDPARPADEE